MTRLLLPIACAVVVGCGEPPAGPIAGPAPAAAIDPAKTAAEGAKAIADKKEAIRNAPNLTPEQKEQALRMLGER